MNATVDNVIAYRVLSMLVQPFNQSDAFRLGIIDAHGINLIPSAKFTTQEQKNAYNYLTRLVFNLKKILAKLPGGDNKTKNLVAAMFLLKEAYAKHTLQLDQSTLDKVMRKLDEGVTFVDEQLIVEEFLQLEDVANSVGDGKAVSVDEPLFRKPPARKPRRIAGFIVKDSIFNKFRGGKTKFKQWNQYLDLNDDGERTIYDFAKKNPRGIIVLHNGDQKRAIRFNRKGGGSWSKIKRKSSGVM